MVVVCVERSPEIDKLKELSFESDPEVSIFTIGWLVVPQTEVENPRTKSCLGKKGDEFNFHLLFSTGSPSVCPLVCPLSKPVQSLEL